MKHLLFFVAFAVVVVGCENSVPGTDLSAPEAPVPSSARFIPVHSDDDISDDDIAERIEAAPTQQQRETLLQMHAAASEAHTSALLQFNAATRNETDWREAHRAAQPILEGLSGDGYYGEALQVIGNRMLSDFLLSVEQSAEVREAITWYTEQLIAVGHPDASVLLPALERLEQDWSPGRRIAAAEQIREAADAYLAMSLCESCTGDDVQAELLNDARERRLYEMDRAVVSLERLEAGLAQ